MSLYFFLNNLHFSLEMFGALIFLIAAWFSFDSFVLRRDFLTASRGIGFSLLAIWEFIHALDIGGVLMHYVGFAAYIGGIIFILWNLILERPASRPEFKAVIFVPSAAALFWWVDLAASAGMFMIAFISYRQYSYELKKVLRPFWMGFLLLGAGSLMSIFYGENVFGGLWVAGHAFEMAGFAALGVWVWKYLGLRIREELLVIFVAFAFLISVAVGLVFSTILVSRMEADTASGLQVNARVLELAILRFQDEAYAKVRFIAERPELKNAMAKKDFASLEDILGKYADSEKLGFLLAVDKDGEVLLRAHSLTVKGDDISGEYAVRGALAGGTRVTIESSPVEKLSVRASAPVVSGGKVLGAIVLGHSLDSAFADGIKKITGLEMFILEGDTFVAGTIDGADGSGRFRHIGTKITDEAVKDKVLGRGGELTERINILARPYLASFLPLRDAEGKVVGMISAARPQKDILETATATSRLTLIVVMALMLILITPIYFITKRLGGEIH